MRHKLCRSFHPWCPGVKNRCLSAFCVWPEQALGQTNSRYIGDSRHINDTVTDWRLSWVSKYVNHVKEQQFMYRADRFRLLPLYADIVFYICVSLRWRHNGRDGVSNHQPHDCLLNRLFGRRSKKTSKLRVTGLCLWNSLGTGEFPSQMASNAENVSIWWRHDITMTVLALVRHQSIIWTSVWNHREQSLTKIQCNQILFQGFGMI